MESARVVVVVMCFEIDCGPGCGGINVDLLVLGRLLLLETLGRGGEGALFTCPPLFENPDWLVCSSWWHCSCKS